MSVEKKNVHYEQMRYLSYLLREVANRNLYRFLLFLLWNLPFSNQIIHGSDAWWFGGSTHGQISETDNMIILESCGRLSAIWGILDATALMHHGFQIDSSQTIDAPFRCGGIEYSFKITKKPINKSQFIQYTGHMDPNHAHEHLTSIFDTIKESLQSDIFWFLSTTNAILKELSTTQIRNITLDQESHPHAAMQFLQQLKTKSASLGVLHMRIFDLSKKLQNKDRTSGTKRRHLGRRP